MAKVIASTIVALVLWAGAVQVVAAEDVSPELARIAALYVLHTLHPEFFAEPRAVKISEPRIYPSYYGLRKYYVIYIYNGPGDVPSWSDLERNTVKDRYLNKWFRYFIFPAVKSELPSRDIKGGIPPTIGKKNKAEEIIKSKNLFPTPSYSRTIVEGEEIYFVFRSGTKDYLVNTAGSIFSPPDIPGSHKPPDFEKYHRMADDFWNEVNDFNVEEIELGKLRKKSGTDYGNYKPPNWDQEMPNYYQDWGGHFGCVAASAADFLGNYSGAQGYKWKNIPYEPDQYKTLDYGKWIMRFLYDQIKNFCSNPLLCPDMDIAFKGLNNWLGIYGRSYTGWQTNYAKKGYNPVNDWNFITTGLSTKCGYCLGEWPPSSDAIGHCYVIWGYDEVGGQHYLAGWNPEILNGPPQEFAIETKLAQGYKYSCLKCNNPKHGGGYEPAAVNLSYNGDENGVEFRWTQIRGAEVLGYDILTVRCAADNIAFDTIVTLPNDEPGKTDYSVAVPFLEPEQRYYLEIKWQNGFTTIEEFPRRIR